MSIQSVDGRDCLALAGNSDGIAYTTYIYEYDGILKELFIRDGVSASLKSGKDIMELESFQMEEIEEGLFRFVFTDKGMAGSLRLLSQKGARHETVIEPALQHVPDGDHYCNSFLFPGKRLLSAYFYCIPPDGTGYQ